MKIYIFATIAALSAVATTAAGDIPLQRGLQKCYSCSKKGQYWIYKNGDGKCEKKWCEEKDMCIYKKVIDNKWCDDDDDDDDDKKDCGDKEEDCCKLPVPTFYVRSHGFTVLFCAMTAWRPVWTTY